MKLNLKYRLCLLAFTVLLFNFGFALMVAMAQTNDVPSGDTSIPFDRSTFTALVISAITPLIVSGIAWLAPKIPAMLLPVITPLIGVLLGVVLNRLAGFNLSWLDMAEAGAVAVFIRETWNQTITKTLAGRPLLSPRTPDKDQ